MSLTIYAASDDLIEIDGDIVDEYELDETGRTRLRLTAPNGDTLDVTAAYGTPYAPAELEWTISVEALNNYPAWPIRFHERPDMAGDPAVTIDTPPGTLITQVEAND